MSAPRNIPAPQQRDVTGFFTKPGSRPKESEVENERRPLPGPPPTPRTTPHQTAASLVPEAEPVPQDQVEYAKQQPKGPRVKVNVGLTLPTADAVSGRAEREGISYTAVLIDAYGKAIEALGRHAGERKAVTSEGFNPRFTPAQDLPKGRAITTFYLYRSEVDKIDGDVERLSLSSRSELVEAVLRHHLLTPTLT